MKKKSLLGIILIITLCALILLSSGCFQLSESSTSETADNLRLDIDDGNDDLGSDGSDFAVGQAILRIEQTGGDPIDWSKMTIYCEEHDTGNRIKLVIITCNNAPYDANTNSKTLTGQVIELGVGSDGDFQSGTYLEISITKGDDMVYKSQTIHVE